MNQRHAATHALLLLGGLVSTLEHVLDLQESGIIWILILQGNVNLLSDARKIIPFDRPLIKSGVNCTGPTITLAPSGRDESRRRYPLNIRKSILKDYVKLPGDKVSKLSFIRSFSTPEYRGIQTGFEIFPSGFRNFAFHCGPPLDPYRPCL